MLHLQLLLRAGQSPTVLSESEERRFHSGPFEQQQLFCLCCQAINAGSPPHPPPTPGMEQLPAARIRLPGRYLSQARCVLSWGNEPQLCCCCSLCRGWASFISFNPTPSQGKPALQAHLGWAAPPWLPAAGSKASNKASPGCIASDHPPSPGREPRAVPPAPPPPGRSQLPAPGVPWGKRERFPGACLSRPNRPVFPV